MRRRLIGAAVVALSLAVVPAIAASATGGSSVSINQHADFDTFGTRLDVGLLVRCTGGSGTVTVDVTQDPPESPFHAEGFGNSLVVCDGHTHGVGVTIIGAVFDAGRANATANLMAPSGNVTLSQRIIITVV